MSVLQSHIEALLRDPISEPLADRLRVIARSAGAYREFAEVLRRRSELLVDQHEYSLAVDSLLESARTYEEDLADRESAVRHYARILELKQDHRCAMYSLCSLLHEQGRWEELLAAIRERQQVARSPGERTTLHLFAAEVLSERLDRWPDAFDETKAAVLMSPRNLRSMRRLEALGARLGRMEDVSVVIGDLILQHDDPGVRAALSLRLAEIHLGAIDDRARAVAYLRAAVEDAGGDAARVSDLEDVARERDRIDELSERLERDTEDRRTGPAYVRMRRELARLYEYEMRDPYRALLNLSRAALAAPGDRELLDDLIRVGRVAQAVGQVADTLERVARRTKSPLLATFLWLRVGKLYRDELDNPQNALRAFRKVLEFDPQHGHAQACIDRLVDNLYRGARMH